MSNDFEPIMTALLARLAAATTFATTSRRLKHWSQVSEFPALFLRRTGTLYDADMTFIRTTLVTEAWVYSDTGSDPDGTPDSGLTAIEKALLDQLVPDVDDEEGTRFTLGGLVYWCRPEGRSDMAPGDQGNVAILRLPILITVP
jgi:hypothetical protein